MLHEIELFFLGMGAGILLAVLFDLLRAFRKCKFHPEWAVSLEDFFFWIITAGTIFYLVEVFNKGVLRFYVFLGCILGFLFYFLTITRLLFPVFLTIFKIIKWIFSKCYRIFEKIKKIIKILIILPLKKVLESIKIIRNNI